MAKRKQNYDHDANDKLCNYVRMKYRNQLSNGAMQIYLLGLPYLEKKQFGLCKQVTAKYPEIGQAAFKDPSGLKKPLLELDGVVCDIKLGKPIRDGKKATVIRRYSLPELMGPGLKSKVDDRRPEHAKQLAEILYSRSFVYGDIAACKPYWNVGKTGRVWSREPNVQGGSKRERAEKLCCGLKDGQVLFDIDIKQAEPSIIQQVLGYKFYSDPYEILAKINGVDRAKAKPELNKLAYSKSSVNIIKHWKPRARDVFEPYAVALDAYKEKLFKSGAPINKQRRFADTLGGTRIYAEKVMKNRRGASMNWHIQGTVADIINGACIEIFGRESDAGWRLVFPVHDSVYVIGKNKHAEELMAIITGRAKDLGLDLAVESKVHTV